MQQIIVVDDSPTTLEICKRTLRKIESVDVLGFPSANVALPWACEHKPDLIVVDYRMPEMDGLEFIERFRKSCADHTIPIIVLTASNDAEVRHRALQIGATDFVKKPSDPIEFVARARNLLRLRKSEKHLAEQTDVLERQVHAQTLLVSTQEREMLRSLVRVCAFKEHDGCYGRQHGARIGEYSAMVGKRLGLDRNARHILSVAAPLLDIGKIGVPDKILSKPGRLTESELEIVKTHASIGHEILSGGSSLLMTTAAEIARSHHERWDGKGYPDGLAGDAIPLSARIAAVADVFDALVCARPYRGAWSLPQALDAIRRESGEAFDPKVVDAFVDAQFEIQEIRRRLDEASAA